MNERSIKRRRSNYQAPSARGHANNTSDKPLQNTSPTGAAPIGVDMQGSHSVLSMPVSMPALQNNNFTSLLDRSVARSGLSYDGFVRHITKGALGSLKIWSESDLERLLLTCERLGLDPLGREVYCTEAQDAAADAGAQRKPPLVVVALDGWCRIINSHPQFDGMSFKESAEREGGLPLGIECSMQCADFLHHCFVDTQSTCGINNQYFVMMLPRVIKGRECNRDRFLRGLRREKISTHLSCDCL
jgi:hypothetical protein